MLQQLHQLQWNLPISEHHFETRGNQRSWKRRNLRKPAKPVEPAEPANGPKQAPQQTVVAPAVENNSNRITNTGTSDEYEGI